ncbi:MAG: hypothetical protein IJ566_05695 [Cardiobacteriaceae bacterium]|nr:hypothetical protein [Cardiobacteriaceae bacterium]
MDKPKVVCYDFAPYSVDENYDPRLDHRNFPVWNEWCVSVNVGIGFQLHSHNLYRFEVCSPEYICKYAPTWGRALLIIPDWDIEEILFRVHEIVKQCSAETLEQLYQNLDRYMDWEFYNFQP